MRDFRDAKLMAEILRGAVLGRGLKITVGESLEWIADAFGVADWNTLAAAIRAETPASRKNASPPRNVPSAAAMMYSTELEPTIRRAFAHANKRKHEYTTLEHLLLALLDDADASAVLLACGGDLDRLRKDLTRHLDFELDNLVVDARNEAKPTAAFQRVGQRAVLHVQASGRSPATGANLLVAIFAERESHAAFFLQEQDVTRYDAVNYMSHGVAKRRRSRGGSAV
jgi:Clp amino terminal domain, pathogenicity island component/Glyoxalase superfamily protein